MCWRCLPGAGCETYQVAAQNPRLVTTRLKPPVTTVCTDLALGAMLLGTRTARLRCLPAHSHAVFAFRAKASRAALICHDVNFAPAFACAPELLESSFLFGDMPVDTII